jgi:hypothetical protein
VVVVAVVRMRASASRFARRAWDPAPRRGPADLRWLVGMHTARPLSRAAKSSLSQLAWFTNFDELFLYPRQAPFRERWNPAFTPSKGTPFGLTDQPAKEPAMWLARIWLGKF